MTALMTPLVKICEKLAGTRWKGLLKAHGLDIRSSDPDKLAAELNRRLVGPDGITTINRRLAGFEDFSLEGMRGIEPGSPGQSLFYHALASPNVQTDGAGRLLEFEINGEPFPTLKDLEDVENYIFGIEKPSIDDLLARAGREELAIVVFAYEYRPASQTCHGRHADMVFARTGVARVGTKPAAYHARLRGFLPAASNDAFSVCVSPSRFAAFLAVKMKGSAADFRPMRFLDDDSGSDAKRDFWVPIHKLFSGNSCLAGVPLLKVDYSASHANEKILRIHEKLLGEANVPTHFPYRIVDGDIADLSKIRSHGAGLLVPASHPQLIEEARERGKKKGLTFTVPASKQPAFSSFDATGISSAIPAYIHIRTEVLPDGTRFDLNSLDEATMMARIARGGYQALHYVDFTGDGWVSATCSGFDDATGVDATPLPAYSLVTAPDFFPSCDQRELTEWTQSNQVPQSLRENIWNITPDTLCDERIPANLQLDGSPFDAKDTTMTALVSLFGPTPIGSPQPVVDSLRHSHLPDDAAGVFAPGWDVSVDEFKPKGSSRAIEHLAGYPLGSPFPEDAKLCAALSTFWPAVAPDSTREMEPSIGHQSGSVAPLTDQEIGQVGDLPWDGIPGPRIVTVNEVEFVEYQSFQHVDYVRSALAGLFTMRLTSRVDETEYENRVLATAIAYLALGFERSGAEINPKSIDSERKHWKLLSFLAAESGSPELQLAIAQSGLSLHGPIYRLEFFKPGKLSDVPGHVDRKRLAIVQRFSLYSAPAVMDVAVREGPTGTWHQGRFHV